MWLCVAHLSISDSLGAQNPLFDNWNAFGSPFKFPFMRVYDTVMVYGVAELRDVITKLR